MRRLPQYLALGAALALLGACSGNDPLDPGTGSDALQNADIALAVTDGVGEDVQTMRELNLGIRTGIMFLGGVLDGLHPCPYDAATGWHDCEPRTLPIGLVIDRQYAFHDAAGAPMEHYDAQQTASIRVIRTVDGEFSRQTPTGSVSGEVHHERDLTVSGLQGDEQRRTWDGDGSSEIERTRVVDGRGSRSYDLSTTVEIDEVVVPHANNQERDPWPLSGTITKHVVGTVTVNGETRSVERTVVITFNGTQFAAVAVTGPNGTDTFQIDLANRRLRP